MKIGINGRTFSLNQPSGAVQSAIRITRELADSEDVILFGHQSLAENFRSIPVDGSWYSTRSQIVGLGWERIVLPQLAEKHDVDVLFCPNGNAPLCEISVPTIVLIHDVNAQRGYSSWVHQLYRKLAVPPGVAAADGIVTVSEFSKGEIVSVFDVPSSKVHVVHIGLDSSYFESGNSTAIDVPNRYILFVGALNPRKNIHRLIVAWSLLLERTELPHELVLVGPENKTIFKSTNVPRSETIRTLGFLDRDELKYVYEHADALVFPSMYEGFGLPPLEAMACGTPVVASNVTAMPEILGDAAEFVDPLNVYSIAEGMQTVLTDDTYRTELAERGKQRARAYSWNDTCEHLRSVFEHYS